MLPLHRHQLVRLVPEAWNSLIAVADEAVHAALVHWASGALPLVVARQACGADASSLALGLALPGRWGRRRLSVSVALTQISSVTTFPDARVLAGLLERDADLALAHLCDGLQASGLQARVFGSHGWQWITGLTYVHPLSDLDLLVSVADAASADTAVALMDAYLPTVPRLDGELVFADGTAVAWREWLNWRVGRFDQVLLKRIDGVRLASDLEWLAQRPDARVPACS